MIRKISIPLSDQEFNRLQIVAQRGYRRVQDYARMVVLESLQDCDNSPDVAKDNSTGVRQDKAGAVVMINP